MVDLSRQAFLGAFLTLQYLQLLKLHVNGGTSAYKKCRKIAKQVRQTHSGIARVIVWGGSSERRSHSRGSAPQLLHGFRLFKWS